MAGSTIGTLVRSLGYLPFLAALCVPAAALGAESASRAPAAPAAGVLASVKGQVSVDRPNGARSVTGTIGMRLMPGDGLRVGPGSSATVYLAGGSIVRVPEGGRIEIPRASAGGSGAPTGGGKAAGAGAPAGGASVGASAMSSRSVEVLEPGLWILNDPEGSVLLSAMRGEDDAWDDGGGAGPLLLSPRFETVLEARPRFVWSATSGPVRIALARGKDVLWRSSPGTASSLSLPEDAPKLKAGEAYRWWLESGDGGVPLGEAAPFRIATREVQNEATEFEKEVTALEAGDDGPALAGLLRSGYYLKIGAWSRVLTAAAVLGRSESASAIGPRALEGCRRQMRLTQVGVDQFVALSAAPDR